MTIGRAVLADRLGLFVPKPSRAVDCQRRGTLDLGATVRQCLLASTAGGGDCYSLTRPGAQATQPWRPAGRPNGMRLSTLKTLLIAAWAVMAVAGCAATHTTT